MFLLRNMRIPCYAKYGWAKCYRNTVKIRGGPTAVTGDNTRKATIWQMPDGKGG
jgi:hypothetical protein